MMKLPVSVAWAAGTGASLSNRVAVQSAERDMSPEAMAGIETAVEAARRYIIKRPRLTRLLDNANARALMLVAPAGFGKTTLAREWVADRPHVWYRGTTATADVAALIAGLSTAISEVIPEVGARAVGPHARHRHARAGRRHPRRPFRRGPRRVARRRSGSSSTTTSSRWRRRHPSASSTASSDGRRSSCSSRAGSAHVGLGAAAPVRRDLRARSERAGDGPRRSRGSARASQGRPCRGSRRAGRGLAGRHRPGSTDRRPRPSRRLLAGHAVRVLG